VWSHRSASQGASALLAALELASDSQRLELARRLRELQGGGLQLRQGEWPAQLVGELPALERRLGGGSSASGSSSSGGSAAAVQQVPKAAPKGVPVFLSDAFLEEAVQPAQRALSPLTEQQVEKIMVKWKQDHLLEHFRAAERRCLPKEGEAARQ